MIQVAIYSRVSSLIQDYKRQTDELIDFSKKMGYEVVGIFEEKISGGKLNEERPALMEMMELIKTKKINKVLCWELSRIGRNTIQVLQTIKLLNDNCISLYIKNYNLETLTDKCEINPLTQFMIQILTSVSEMEKTTIRQRMNSGYIQFINNGGKVGRKEGFKKDEEKILEDYKEVVKRLKQGCSIRDVMKLCEVSSGTAQKVKRLMVKNGSL